MVCPLLPLLAFLPAIQHVESVLETAELVSEYNHSDWQFGSVDKKRNGIEEGKQTTEVKRE